MRRFSIATFLFALAGLALATPGWAAQQKAQAAPAGLADDLHLEVRTAIPKIQSGLVRWLPSFAWAKEAAKKSGKPVLLFQLVGNLDESLC